MSALAVVSVSVLVACGEDSIGEGSGAPEPGGAGGEATGAGGPGNGGSGNSDGGGAPSASSTSSGAGAGGNGSGGNPSGSQCASSRFTWCEDFEGAADGEFPDGWGPRGDEWGEGTMGVASDDARFGARSLKVDGGNNGQHFMVRLGGLGALASHHYGRVFMKVAVPAPWPQSGVLHADFIEGLGPNNDGGTHNVRWGVVENTDEKFQWIYNVQPSNAGEWAEGTSYDYQWSGAWQCIEWVYDEPSQSGTLWIDGQEIPIEPGANHAAEIPVFESLGVGLANYQDAGEGFTVWFDELAYDDARIGCDE
ncbi:MAG: hypothetical protein WKG00_02890 [Polyangiaceae bacterium]